MEALPREQAVPAWWQAQAAEPALLLDQAVVTRRETVLPGGPGVERVRLQLPDVEERAERLRVEARVLKEVGGGTRGTRPSPRLRDRRSPPLPAPTKTSKVHLDLVQRRNKIRRRDTTEGTTVGAVVGTVSRPHSLLMGRYDPGGALKLVARSTQLSAERARRLVGRLTAAGPGSPWDGVRFTTSWGSRTPLDVVLVEPVLVAQIDAVLRICATVRAEGRSRLVPVGPLDGE